MISCMSNRARVSALYAQLFPQGILTSVKTTAQQSFSDDSNVGTDVKIIKAEAKSTEGGSEGIEHMFDASWSVPLDVLARLKSLSLVRGSLRGAGLGSVVLADCLLRVIDFRSMNNLWAPALRIALANGQQQPQQVLPEVVPILTEALKAVPQAIHAHFFDEGGIPLVLTATRKPHHLHDRPNAEIRRRNIRAVEASLRP